MSPLLLPCLTKRFLPAAENTVPQRDCVAEWRPRLGEISSLPLAATFAASSPTLYPYVSPCSVASPSQLPDGGQDCTPELVGFCATQQLFGGAVSGTKHRTAHLSLRGSALCRTHMVALYAGQRSEHAVHSGEQRAAAVGDHVLPSGAQSRHQRPHEPGGACARHHGASLLLL